MPKHIFETKMFAFIVFFCTVAALAASSLAFYPKYQAEAELESYAPTPNAVKISEEIKIQRRSNKSSSWSEHIPCITLKLSDDSAPLTACKLTGFVDSPDQAKQFLASNFGGASGFTVYVSADKQKASLEGYDPARAKSALLPLVLIFVILPVCMFGFFYYFRRMVKKARGDAEK